MMNMMDRMVEGRAQEREIDMLLELTKQVEGHTICALGGTSFALATSKKLMSAFRCRRLAHPGSHASLPPRS